EKYKKQHRPVFDYEALISNMHHSSEYSYEEFCMLLTPIIQRWSALSGIDLAENKSYDPMNPFTWNYSSRGVPGYWRGIYKQVYGTDRPHTHPWEMFGFSIKPDWWENRY